MTPAEILGQPLQLPRGGTLPNRMFKSAMSECLGTPTHAPSEGLARLYRTWAEGGVGLMVTGNVMIDRAALGEPANVVVEDDRDLDALTAWADAGQGAGGQVWMQLNHPGKQSPSFLSKAPVAPSAIPLGSGLEKVFTPPRALTDDEVLAIVERFGTAAAVAKRAGFRGVQIHGAHGYLVSQFLSPHHNRRADRWGGSLENRARFALEVYRAIRQAVGDDFPIGIKINSADFQKGGFTEAQSIEVIAALVDAGIDLVEISGGNYESPAMTGAGQRKRASTVEREAYFLAFAATLRARVDVVLGVTGGFRTSRGMAAAIESGDVDLVGMARPLALEPDLPGRILGGEDVTSRVRRLTTGSKALDRVGMLEVTYYETQLARMAAGKPAAPTMSALRALTSTMTRQGLQAFRQRRAR